MRHSASWALLCALLLMLAATGETKGHSTGSKKSGAPGPMSLIPSGFFQMGSQIWRANPTDEYPEHIVWIDEFYMDKYEVTVAQYLRFTKVSGRKMPTTHAGNFYPITGVSWHDATAYCKWAGKRLPTEAQWEKAARPDNPHTLKRFKPFGEQLRYSKIQTEATRPVGQAPPNRYGLYDMDGNAWEWCADWYDENYYAHSPAKNPKGPEFGNTRVLRGAFSQYRLGVGTFRPTARMCAWPDETRDYGFRCAQDSTALKKTYEKTK